MREGEDADEKHSRQKMPDIDGVTPAVSGLHDGSARYREHFWGVRRIDNFCTWWMGIWETVGDCELTSYIVQPYDSFEAASILLLVSLILV